tara:strand:- start:7442 stop:9847 length:2406 start_codon:yes stop_codon:yes gene_type:complete
MAGYTRQSTFADGDVIQAADSNDEFNQLLASFVNTTGHKHDGTTAEGPVIGLIGDPGVATPLNKVVVDNTNNRVGLFVDAGGAGSSVEQLRFQDGAIVPVTDNDIDLGTASLEFKDAFFDGTVTTDALVADTVDINGGTIDGVTIGANSVITNLVVDNIAINGSNIGHTGDTDLLTLASGILTVAGEVSMTTLDIGGTNVSSTAAELNILDGVTSTTAELNLVDGDTSAGTTAVAGGDGIVTNDGGTMRQTTVDTFDTYLSQTTKTLTNKTLTTPVIAEIDSGADITLDATADIILDAGGANVIFKDDGTSILDIANNSSDVELTVSTADKNFAIKGTDGSSGITALDIDMALAGKATFSGDVVVTGDLTVTGDDITMNTNTAGHMLVGDGTNYNPVAISGDVTMAGTGAVTIASAAVEGSMLNANVITGQTQETTIDTSNDLLLFYDNSATALRKVPVTNLVSAAGGLTDVVADTSPQLGGNLDTNSQNILIDDAHFIADESGNEQIIFQTTGSAVNQIDVTNAATGNAPEISATGDDTNVSLKLTPKGTGQVLLDGNVGIESGVIDLKNGGAVSNIKFYCESSNAHYTALQSSAHSTYSGDVTLTLPAATDTLVGKATTDTLTNKTLTTPIANAGIQLKNGATSAGFLEFFEDSDSGTNKVTLIGPATTGDVTVTLPTSTGTVALTSDVPSSGISSGNVATFTSGAVDDDFLRIDGTTIEGRSASEVLSDIGAQASLTFGISNTNAVKIDSASVADDEYARFTASGLESRSTSEVLSDIGAVSAAVASADATALAIALG